MKWYLRKSSFNPFFLWVGKFPHSDSQYVALSYNGLDSPWLSRDLSMCSWGLARLGQSSEDKHCHLPACQNCSFTSGDPLIEYTFRLHVNSPPPPPPHLSDTKCMSRTHKGEGGFECVSAYLGTYWMYLGEIWCWQPLPFGIIHLIC